MSLILAGNVELADMLFTYEAKDGMTTDSINFLLKYLSMFL